MAGGFKTSLDGGKTKSKWGGLELVLGLFGGYLEYDCSLSHGFSVGFHAHGAHKSM